jgi:predicted dehydrogenase
VLEGSSCYFGGSGEWDVALLGTKGQARFQFWGGKAEVFLTEATEGLPAREWVQQEEEAYTHVEFYEELAAALKAGRTPPVTGEDGRKALEVVVAIYRSAESGAPQELPL